MDDEWDFDSYEPQYIENKPKPQISPKKPKINNYADDDDDWDIEDDFDDFSKQDFCKKKVMGYNQEQIGSKGNKYPFAK